jgi:hypothetical protein
MPLSVLELEFPSQWSTQHRVLKMENSAVKPYSFAGYEFMLDIHDDTYSDKAIKKAAQVGLTELAINIALWAVDGKKDVMYLLPTDGDASDFSAGRFDPALVASDYLRNMFTDVSNVGHKRAGLANLYVRGAGGGGKKARSKLKSVPASVLIFDEYDEMLSDMVSLAEYRVSGRQDTLQLRLSTPRIPETGIDAAYRDSTQGIYLVRCESCNHDQNLTLKNFDWDGTNPESAKYICRKCRKAWNDLERAAMIAKGFWYHQKNHTRGGYWIPKFYSVMQPNPNAPNKPTPGSAIWLAELYKKSLSDKVKEQEFYNSALGLAHLIEGSKLSEVEIRSNIRDYAMVTKWDSAFVTMGIDVGSWLHYEIALWINGCKKVLRAGKVKKFDELGAIIKAFRAKCFVVDGEPETRASRDFIESFPGIGWMGDERDQGKDAIALDEKHHIVAISRTELLDITLDRFRGTDKIQLPKDISEEYVKHCSSLVRIYEKNNDGVYIPVYRNTGDDHYAHASLFNEVAGMIFKKQGGGYTSNPELDKVFAPRNDRESAKQPD